MGTTGSTSFYIFGEGFIADGYGEGSYQGTSYKSWKLKSESAKKKHQIVVATHIEQTETIDEWKESLAKTIDLCGNEQEKAFFELQKVFLAIQHKLEKYKMAGSNPPEYLLQRFEQAKRNLHIFSKALERMD